MLQSSGAPEQEISAKARPLRLARFLALFLLAALIALIGMVLLPQDKYLRYQSLNDGSIANAYWIYERIHFDPTPIDIAFIGTSRTGRSIQTKRLEEDLARAGVTAKAANFFIFKNGRNMHYAIAKELLEHRKVKLLVLEMTEAEDRTPHPDFVFLADPIDIVGAPMFINLRYLSDLARLPGRQFDLFAQTIQEKLRLGTPDFVPPPYQGPNLDGAEFMVDVSGRRHYFLQEHSLAQMETLRREQDSRETPAVLPARWNWLEYRYPRLYIARILELAARNGTKVVFLYIPRYGGPPTPAPYLQYAARIGLINPASPMRDFRLYDDAVHANWQGAKVLTDYVAKSLAESDYLKATPSPSP
jgi:hypothetical protein